jgi:hypothetical protein
MQGLSIGAVGAAIVAGLISLLGLIVAKEQKTSEFRQAWIDGLRAELVSYLTGINSAIDASSIDSENEQDRQNSLRPIYESINAAAFAISLRLNPDEQCAQDVLQNMGKLSALITSGTSIEGANIRPLEEQFLISSKNMLKQEWNRVKEGEPSFRVTKIVLISCLCLSPILLIVSYL